MTLQQPTQADEKERMLSASIMIVDDDPVNIDVVQAFLEDDGYTRFLNVEDPRRAMGVIEASRPDLLLLDLVMPDISGFEILAQVRSHPKFSHLPVIVLTAATDAASKLKALELGATDFLAKPLDQSELVLRVRNTLHAKAYQDQLAYYDPLTNLPNRQLFMEDLSRTLLEQRRLGKLVALLTLQIDQFNRINDQIGQAAGDAILVNAVARIQTVVRAHDLITRIAPDDFEAKLFHLDNNAFSLLLLGLQNSDNAAKVAARIRTKIAEPVLIEGHEMYLTASVGIAIYPMETEVPHELLHLASSAKDSALEAGGDNFRFSSKQSMQTYQERLTAETRLRQAITNQEFVLYYQPKVSLLTGKILGAEALVRWQAGDRLIPPLEFVPLAEETGLIIPLGLWCIEDGFQQLKQWQTTGYKPMSLSVNLSARQFVDHTFMAAVEELVARCEIDTRSITLELTESLVMDDLEEKLLLLKKLKHLGFKLSIDDFGTGYSSLSYLRKLPIDELKIDRSFIMETSEHEDSRAIVATIVFLAKQLNLLTVAEGVEQPEELNFLRSLQCDQYQGHFYSPPVSSKDFEALLAAETA